MTRPKAKTSETAPLIIATVQTPVGGTLGLTFCPGKRDQHAMSGSWDRDLDLDLQAICDWGASGLITLMESHELASLGVPDLGARAGAYGLRWWHMPIVDVSIPTTDFEVRWSKAWGPLRDLLGKGTQVVIHCKGGLGRTGLVAARILVDLGMKPDAAIRLVRSARSGAIETPGQKQYVLERAWDH